jgi:dihydroorotate dehydrogenase electron transfer subunit
LSYPPRAHAPIGRRSAGVVAAHDVGPYRVLSVSDPSGPPRPRPGQFYMLSAAAGWGGGVDERPYLPRAFSFCRARGDGTLDFLLEAIGPGTRRLAELRPGERAWLVGPLGNGFEPRPGARPLLVGGGIGVAPIVCLSDALPDAEVLLGFRSEHHAAARELFARAPLLATDDGSVGRRALVTELLREAIDSDRGVEVYACGPPPMLEAVRALCAEREVPAQLALEAGMACGYGACFGCVHPTRDGYVRLCVDGPVLEGGALDTAYQRGERVEAA